MRESTAVVVVVGWTDVVDVDIGNGDVDCYMEGGRQCVRGEGSDIY